MREGRLCGVTYEDGKITNVHIRDADGEVKVFEPVKHGRWLPQIPFSELIVFCSECKTIGSPVWKRCPVCEAKMDLEVDT